MTAQQEIVQAQLRGSIALTEEPMTTTLAKQEPHGELMQPSANPTGILQIAISRNADIDQLTKLLELQERWEAGEARKAFNKAFSAFKAEAIVIVKNVAVNDGPLKGKKYADLFGVVSVVTPYLSKHGLSHSWRLTRDDKDWMEVTCTISHELGHSESVSMGAAPDTGPGRNAIQARASSKSYLERYTFLGATGLAAGGEDNDGNSTKGLDKENFDRMCGLIEGADTKQKLQAEYFKAIGAAQIVNDEGAQRKFIELKDKRFKELS